MDDFSSFLDLSGRTAIVTGASRGIGREIALTLGGCGAQVVVNYAHSEDLARAVVATIDGGGGHALAVQADVRRLEEVTAMVEAAKSAFGSVDILVNNAGVLLDKPVTFLTDEEWDTVLDVNLKGAFHCIKACGREMARKRYGRMINISSAAGLMGDAMRANYSSAKAGLIGLTKGVAREFAASGITVNAVAPGIIETEMIAEMPQAKKEKQLALIPLRRFGKVEEVAGLVAYLASGKAGYITGQVLQVDGGLRM